MLSWLQFLPDSAIEQLRSEVAKVDSVPALTQLLIEWQHTAEVYADPESHAVLSRPHDGDYGPVPRSAAA